MLAAPRLLQLRVRLGRILLVWVILGALTLFTPFSLFPPSHALSAEDPTPPGGPPIARGLFLIASPNLMDPNFRHTVVLICEHNGEQGTLGLILNRPTDVSLAEALPQVSVLKATSYIVFWGGPVQQSSLLMLFRLAQAPPEPKEVLRGVYLGAGPETLTQVITKPNPTETFRAYAGYAGWAPGQLEYELSLGSWAVVTADAASIFDRDPAGLWMEMLDKLRAPRVIRSHHPSLSPVTPVP
jgi:putative transcriptional regulator